MSTPNHHNNAASLSLLTTILSTPTRGLESRSRELRHSIEDDWAGMSLLFFYLLTSIYINYNNDPPPSLYHINTPQDQCQCPPVYTVATKWHHVATTTEGTTGVLGAKGRDSRKGVKGFEMPRLEQVCLIFSTSTVIASLPYQFRVLLLCLWIYILIQITLPDPNWTDSWWHMRTN
jgi:hypothetical protein